MGQIFSKIQSLFEHNFNEEINFQTEEINDFPSKWRCISPGLTVEGICTNNSCLAYNKKVIHNVGFGEFDILKSEAFCPMCKESIIPLAPGFSQCFCHIKYKKKSCQEKQIPWLKTTNKYKIFQQDESCAVEYEKLEIDARELGTGQLVEKSIQEQIDVIRKEQAQILKEKEDAQIDKENQQVENEYEQHSVLLLDGSNVISDGAYAQHIFAVNEFINIQSQKGGVQTVISYSDQTQVQFKRQQNISLQQTDRLRGEQSDIKIALQKAIEIFNEKLDENNRRIVLFANNDCNIDIKDECDQLEKMDVRIDVISTCNINQQTPDKLLEICRMLSNDNLIYTNIYPSSFSQTDIYSIPSPSPSPIIRYTSPSPIQPQLVYINGNDDNRISNYKAMNEIYQLVQNNINNSQQNTQQSDMFIHLIKIQRFIYDDSGNMSKIDIERCEGGTLRQYMDLMKEKNQTISVKDAWKFIQQFAESISQLHNSGICHGDLRPECVWLTPNHLLKLDNYGSGKQIKALTDQMKIYTFTLIVQFFSFIKSIYYLKVPPSHLSMSILDILPECVWLTPNHLLKLDNYGSGKQIKALTDYKCIYCSEILYKPPELLPKQNSQQQKDYDEQIWKEQLERDITDEQIMQQMMIDCKEVELEIIKDKEKESNNPKEKKQQEQEEINHSQERFEADIWSMGTITTELITQKHPFFNSDIV